MHILTVRETELWKNEQRNLKRKTNMNNELKIQFAFQIEIISAIYWALPMCQAYHYMRNEIL